MIMAMVDVLCKIVELLQLMSMPTKFRQAHTLTLTLTVCSHNKFNNHAPTNMCIIYIYLFCLQGGKETTEPARASEQTRKTELKTKFMLDMILFMLFYIIIMYVVGICAF